MQADIVSKTRTVAGTHIRYPPTEEEHLANAHLIAAAPDLLRDAEDLLQLIRDERDRSPDERDRERFWAAFDALKASASAARHGRPREEGGDQSGQ